MTPKTMSVAEYARRRGVSHTAVRKAIKSGRLSRSIAVKDGKHQISPVVADQEWKTNTRPRTMPTERQVDGSAAIIKSRAMHEGYRARLKKLDFEERVGQLVEADSQYREGFEEGRRVRNALFAMADRLAPLVAHETEEREVKALLLQEITDCLRGLAGGAAPAGFVTSVSTGAP